MTADLVARLEAEADLRDFVWTDTPTVNAPSKPVYSARVRALLREAASALRSSGEAVEPHCSGHERFDYDCIDCSDALERKRKGNAPGDGTYTATPASAWRPIAEAPRNGRHVWLADANNMRVGFGAISESRWIDYHAAESGEAVRGLRFEPTHFQPLPTPPTSTKGG